MISTRKVAIAVAACQIAKAQSCADSTTWTDPSGWDCSSYSGYTCEGYAFTADLIANCPNICGNCPPAIPATGAAEEAAAEDNLMDKAEEETPGPGEYNQNVASVGNAGVSQANAQKLLQLTNKMRCSVGVGPVKWNPDLAAQAQNSQDSIGASEHDASYSLPLPAGENIATGTDVDVANWMWFSEFTQLNNGYSTGHYTCMTWKGVTEIGCGMGNDVVRCQYKGSGSNGLCNMQGQESANVLPFNANDKAAKMTECNLPADELKKQLDMFVEWRILTPESGTYRLYLVDKIRQTRQMAAQPFMIAGGALAAVACIGITLKRALRMRAADEDLENAVDDGAE